MPNYIRAKITGGCYFFTVVTHHRRPILCDEPVRTALKNAIKQTQNQYPFEIVAIVLLPDHLHCIWQLPENDRDFSIRWANIKRHVTKNIPQYHLSNEQLTPSQIKKFEKGIWQRRFYEHLICNEQDLHNHLNYIHYNPVKHGLVAQPKDWQFSTFHKYVKMGFYDAKWGAGVQIDGDFE